MDGSSPPKKSVSASAPPAQSETQSAEPAATATPAAASTSAARKSVASQSDFGAHDDPFAVENSSVGTDLRRARRKPQRGCMHRVVCPMCETQGFVPKSAAGEEIRCANPKCLVPVFTAPPLPKKEAPEEAPASSTPLWLVALLLIVVLGAAGGGIWVFVLQPEKTDPVVGPGELNQPFNNVAQNQIDPTNKTSDNLKNGAENGAENGPPDRPVQTKYPALSLPEQQQMILSQIVAEAQSRRANRSKPFCRRMAAETFALAGDLAAAERQLQQLNELSNTLPYYNIQPLVLIAWQQIANNQKGQAVETITKAAELIPSIPKYGRGAVDAATALSAVLCLNDQFKKADSLLMTNQSQDEMALLSAQGHIITCLHDRYRDVKTIQKLTHNLLDRRAAGEGGLLSEWLAPQRVAVAADLFTAQQLSALEKWIYSNSNPLQQTQSLLACVDLLPQTAAADDLQTKLIEISSQLPAAGQGAVLARLAYHPMAMGQKPVSGKQLEQAVALVSKQDAKQDAFGLGDPQKFKTVLDIKLPDAIQAKLAAVSFLECARVYATNQDTENAAKMLGLSLKQARSYAPSMPAIEVRLQAIQTLGERGMLRQIKDQLNLNLDAQAKSTYRQYKKQCEQLYEIAASRHQLETEILLAASLWGLQQQVWDEIQARGGEADINLKANFKQTNLYYVLAAQFENADQQELASQLRQQASSKNEMISNQTARLLAESKTTPLSSLPAKFEKLRLSNYVKYRWALLLSNDICQTNSWPETLDFIQSLRNPIWKEDCLRLAAAVYAHAGQREQILHELENTNLNPTEAVSVYRGLIVGLHAR